MAIFRILIADDHEVVRKGLRALLEAQPGWKVIAEAIDGREAVEKAKDMHPDVAIVDIGMPCLNGLEATRQIVKKAPRTRVLVLTMHDTNPLIQQVVKAGARGYLFKSMAPERMFQVIRKVHTGKTHVPTEIAVHLAEHLSDEQLTRRELDVLEQMAGGNRTRASELLGISVRTLRNKLNTPAESAEDEQPN